MLKVQVLSDEHAQDPVQVGHRRRVDGGRVIGDFVPHRREWMRDDVQNLHTCGQDGVTS